MGALTPTLLLECLNTSCKVNAGVPGQAGVKTNRHMEANRSRKGNYLALYWYPFAILSFEQNDSANLNVCQNETTKLTSQLWFNSNNECVANLVDWAVAAECAGILIFPPLFDNVDECVPKDLGCSLIINKK